MPLRLVNGFQIFFYLLIFNYLSPYRSGLLSAFDSTYSPNQKSLLLFHSWFRNGRTPLPGLYSYSSIVIDFFGGL